MERARGHSSLAERLADLDNPAPEEHDPEGFGDAFDRKRADSDSEGADILTDENDGREHYEAVRYPPLAEFSIAERVRANSDSKSKLRRSEGPLLGKQYSGARISRGSLVNDDGVEDSDNPFEVGPSASNSDEDRDDSGAGREELDGDFVDPDNMEMDDVINEDDEIDSDEAFGEGDEERYAKFVFRSSRGPDDVEMSGALSGSDEEDDNDEWEGVEKGEGRVGEDVGSDKKDESPLKRDSKAWSSENEANDDVSVSDEEDSESEADSNYPNEAAALFDKAAVRALMATEQKAVIATVSEATKADAAKGAAVKHQRESFNSLLNTRIRLQKSIIGANSLLQVGQSSDSSQAFDGGAIEAAESAAIELFNGLTALRASLRSDIPLESREMPFFATPSTPLEGYHDYLKAAETDSNRNHRSTLSRWAEKTQLASSLPVNNKFSAAKIPPLTSVLDSQLLGSNLARHISRTRIPRNCAPLQAGAGAQEDPTIYDDADWYSMLLRELVDSKMSSSASNGSATRFNSTVDVEGFDRSLSDIRRENKVHRKGVDVKASKGRKMRYTIHEKLQNFDPPQDVGTWAVRQAEELFAGLLGRKVQGGLAEGVEDEDNGTIEVEVEGLRLFSGGGG